VLGQLSVPEFGNAFDSEKQAIINTELKEDLLYLTSALSDAVNQ
jgi:hypothetical protein